MGGLAHRLGHCAGPGALITHAALELELMLSCELLGPLGKDLQQLLETVWGPTKFIPLFLPLDPFSWLSSLGPQWDSLSKVSCCSSFIGEILEQLKDNI